MNQRIRCTGQYCTELREQLNEANNKISRTFLEKAILSTQLLKLENELKNLKREMPDKENQVNIKLLCELGTSKNTINTSQSYLKKITRDLELQSCRKHKQLLAENKRKDSGQAQDTGTMTNLSQSPWSFEPQSACRICQNKTPQASETDRVSVFTGHSLREQLEESTKRANQLQQEKLLAIKKLQILERHYLMPAVSAETSSLKATNGTEPCENGRLRIIQSIQDCPSVTEDQPDECNKVPNPPSCSDQSDLQQKDTPSHFPDGLFRAELVDICSSADGEEEDLRTTNKLCHI